ncbi:MAG: hypothetical protein ACYSUM_20855 [Planctomycetota bacterium]|jgi:hypothetical protein
MTDGARRGGAWLRELLGFALALLALAPASATRALDTASTSPDVSVVLGGTTFDDEDVAVDNLLGIVLPMNLGSLPPAADVDAYHLEASGDRLFSLDHTVALPGGLTAQPADVVRYDAALASYSLVLRPPTSIVRAGVGTDAITRAADGDLLLSFDSAVAIDATLADDEDLVRVDGTVYSLFFDASSAGVPASLDLDGAHHNPVDGHLFLSFDSSGKLGDVHFDDEDILEYDPGADTWAMAFDASAQHAAWAPADADAIAVPEPHRLLMLVAGSALLVGVGRKRIRP